MTSSAKSDDKKNETSGHIHGPHCNHGHGHGSDHDHDHVKPKQLVNEGPRIGRNDPCPCGSQKKFKKCCGQ